MNEKVLSGGVANLAERPSAPPRPPGGSPHAAKAQASPFCSVLPPSPPPAPKRKRLIPAEPRRAGEQPRWGIFALAKLRSCPPMGGLSCDTPLVRSALLAEHYSLTARHSSAIDRRKWFRRENCPRAGVSLAAHPGENKPRAKRSPRLREFRTNASGGARPREVTVFHPTNAPSPHISPTRGGSDFSRPAPRLM